MEIKTYSYRFSKEILTNPKFIYIYNEIINICRQCPIPCFKGKSKSQPDKDVVQQMMNYYFEKRFCDVGWSCETYASPESDEDALRLDFFKSFPIPNISEKNKSEKKELKVAVEVEFGNVGSSYRDYFKFQLSYSSDLADICIFVVPSSSLANRIDSGVSNFEKTLREIPSAELSFTMPILIIGLFEDNYEWDVKELEGDISKLKQRGGKITDLGRKIVNDYIDSIRG
jgi:hypothetical protein